jgi:integral membrane protein
VPESSQARIRSIVRLRVIAFLEGVSYLLLLGLAMPLKYLAGMPLAVRVTGLAHGLLFMAFIGAVAHVAMTMNWGRRRILGALVASIVPFGTFALDRRLSEDQRRLGQDDG